MGTINRKIARFDFTVVYSHPQAKVDIILLHGLNGAPQKTWTAGNKVHWPTDLLPKTLEENGAYANVLVWGYNADVFSGKHRHPSQNFLFQHGQNMVNYLASLRRDNKSLRNPVIWVAHSFGGLVLKSALSHADRCRDPSLEHLRSMFVSTFGIVFLGTPHEGSDLAKWGELVQGMVEMAAPKRMFESRSILLKTLRSNSEALQNTNFEFVHIMQKFEVCLVYEEETTNIGGLTRRVVVDQKSAAPTFWNGKAQKFGIEANHSDMCKFSSTDAPGYRSLSSCILDWVKRAPDFIVARWQTEDENRRLQAMAALRELATSLGSQELAVPPKGAAGATDTKQPAPPSPIPMLRMPTSNRPSQSSETSELESLKEPPFFYHPEVFRPNSYFVGREEELAELHRMLQDPERRRDGTSAVLVRARTGGGKTHVVRRYVFEHRDDYSGGVYWLHAHSFAELELELPRLWHFITQKQHTVEDGNDVLSSVRSWFNTRKNWLIILDGIMSDEGIERFVPDAANTALIYTSTSPSFTGDYLYDNPRLLELPPFSVQDAQQLLLEEMELKQPWSQHDLNQAAQVVRLVEKLPLMIHVLAQQMKETREPLSAFLKRYKNKPNFHRKIQPFDFVLGRLDERGASAAANVLYVLAFFDQYIPVEMLALGLRALRLPWRTGEAGTHERPSLNNTLRVLIAFALIERSDSHEISPTSSRTSKRSMSLERSAPPMDTLKVYPLVQRYVVEYMEGESQHRGEKNMDYEGQQREKVHIYWLQSAIDVYCKSFQEADAKIKDNPRIGLPVDYHRYRVHGRKLLQHVIHYESSAVELTPCRMMMEVTLEYVDQRFEELHEQASPMSSTTSGEPHSFSVFDRANSLSESESGTLSSQSNSQEAITPPPGEQSQHYLSPVQDQFPPHGLPYPVEEETVDENGGVTPKQYFNELAQHTRTQSQGAMGNSLWGPPEVGISHGCASISSFQSTRKSSRGSVSGFSEAESALLKTRRNLSRSPSRGGGVAQTQGRISSSATRSNAADLVKSGEAHYASPTPAGLTPSDEKLAAEFSLGPAAASAVSRRSSFMDRVKENMPFGGWRRKSFANSAARPNFEAPTSAKSSPGIGQTAVMPMLPGLSERSVKSSPGQDVAPYPPPEMQPTSSLRNPVPPGFPYQHTETYQPSLPRVDSSSIDTTAMSFPTPREDARRGGAFILAGGIASTPMSRGSSRHSSSQSHGRPSGDYGRSTYVPQRATSPLSSQVSSAISVSRPGYLTLDGRDSETPSNMMEPSSVDLRYSEPMGPPDLSLRPRRGSNSSSVYAGTGAVAMPDPFVHTRMGSNSSSVAMGIGSPSLVTAPVPPLRSRRGSSASNLGQQAAIMPSMPSMPPSVSPAPSSRQNRYRRAIGAMRRGSGRGRGRTQSESPSAEFRLQAPGFHSAQGSPEPSSEPMSRGGSGGIVVGSGRDRTMVPFGHATVENVDAASARSRQQRIGLQYPPGVPPRRSSASSTSRASFQSQNSAPSMSRGNSGRGGAGMGLGIAMPGDKLEEEN